MNFKENFLNEYLLLSKDKKSSNLIIADLIKKVVRQLVRSNSRKKPEVNSHIMRL